MNCSIRADDINDTICKCDDYQYHNISALQCLSQNTINLTCLINYNCRLDQNLECINGSCKCNTSYPYWSNGYNQCIMKKSYN